MTDATATKRESRNRVDIREAERFLTALDPKEDVFCFQTFDDCPDRELKDKKLAGHRSGSLADYEDWLIRTNDCGAGVFIAVNRTDGDGRTKKNVTETRALMLDLDGAELAPVHECALPPHIIIETSEGHYHVFWRVADLPLDQWEDVQRSLAKRFDGDPAVATLERCTRLPGFFNCKDADNRFRVRIVEINKLSPYSADDILKEFPPEKKAHKASRSGPIVLPVGVPLAAAEAFVQHKFVQAGHRCLHFYRGGFYYWRGTHYTALEDDAIRSRLYAFLSNARVIKDGRSEPFNPTAAKVNQIFDALKSGVYLDAELEVPFLVPGQRELPADLQLADYIACHNGLLNIDTRELLPHTPIVFNVNALDHDYDPAAPRPDRWYLFLRELWPRDEQARGTLQEIVGLLLTADTSYQKIFLLVGPKRSGKGTIGQVLVGLLGRSNCGHPTMASLGTQFGLWPLIDKRLGLVSDARLDRRGSQQAVEHLLSISGEDPLTIDRKNKEHWTGRLSTRFLILTNELPRFPDASGALASRFVILMLKNSFLQREQLDLKNELRRELPGILNWALRGLKRLREFGYFEMPESSQAALRQLEDLASPVAAFVRDRCVVGGKYRVSATDLFKEWKTWCEEQGIVRPGAQNVFGRNLCAAFPAVRASHSDAERNYEGIALTDDDDNDNDGGGYGRRGLGLD